MPISFLFKLVLTSSSALALFASPALANSSTARIQIEIKPYEYRATNAYPGDTEEGALVEWQERCNTTEEAARRLAGPQFVSFNCGEPHELSSRRSSYYSYRSLGYLELQGVKEIKVFEEPITSGLVDVTEFEGEEYKWHASRAIARQLYEDECEQFLHGAEREFGDELLFVTCGSWTEDAGKAGWRYSSYPMVILGGN